MYCKLEGISKRFQKDWVLKNINLEIKSGEHVAILGGNGSGKSTLLRIIASQLGPSKGHLLYRCQERFIEPENLYQHLAMVAPYLEIYEQMTFREAARFHFSLRELKVGKSIEQVLQSISVPKDRALKDFSSGMRQRVKLTLAFHTKASLLLLDEPTMNLDEEGSSWFRQQLKAINPDCTVLIASNEVEREASHCQQYFEIREKQVQMLNL